MYAEGKNQRRFSHCTCRESTQGRSWIHHSNIHSKFLKQEFLFGRYVEPPIRYYCMLSSSLLLFSNNQTVAFPDIVLRTAVIFETRPLFFRIEIFKFQTRSNWKERIRKLRVSTFRPGHLNLKLCYIVGGFAFEPEFVSHKILSRWSLDWFRNPVISKTDKHSLG